jgi:hypothetical protein
MGRAKMDSKTVWKSIDVPEALHSKIKELALREQRAMWQVIYDAISYYESQKRKPKIKQELPLLEKVSWYIAKASMAVCWYLATLRDENFDLTMKTLSDIGSRLGVDMSSLTSVLTTYRNIKKKTSKHRAVVLKALKSTVQSMILLLASEGEEKGELRL